MRFLGSFFIATIGAFVFANALGPRTEMSFIFWWLGIFFSIFIGIPLAKKYLQDVSYKREREADFQEELRRDEIRRQSQLNHFQNELNLILEHKRQGLSIEREALELSSRLLAQQRQDSDAGLQSLIDTLNREVR